MELPQALRTAMDKRLQDEAITPLLVRAAQLSSRYRRNEPCGQRLGAAYVTDEADALAYMLARMPATYGAVAAALQQTFPAQAERAAIRRVWDVGAGTGAASWAVAALLADAADITCVEPVPAMSSLGRALMADGPPVLRRARWLTADIARPLPPWDGAPPDLVLASYVLNELPEDEQAQAITHLWEMTRHSLLLIEPGTTYGFTLLKRAREILLAAGAFMTAPCTHDRPCPLPEGDWCHFAARIPRSRIHRLAKAGAAPFEDEKFAYLALSKTPPLSTTQPLRDYARVRRHPAHRKGHTVLSLCAEHGLREETVTRRDGPDYALARKCAWGELYPRPER